MMYMDTVVLIAGEDGYIKYILYFGRLVVHR